MKTIVQSTIFTPSFLVMLVLVAAITFIGVTGKKIPLLSNVKVDVVLVVVIGMAMCMPGIGRVAAENTWTHPLSLLSILLGILILVVATSVFVGFQLPLVRTPQGALLAIAALIGVKIMISLVHSLFL
jgi:hypothetical protein